MFPSRRAMEISIILGNHFIEFCDRLVHIQYHTIKNSSTEVQYFRNLFPRIVEVLDGFSVKDILVRCQAKEVHQKPIVQYGRGKRCELGDYFVNVKYYDGDKLLGRKLVVYQFKMEDARGRTTSTRTRHRPQKHTWKIDQKQLELLCDWPTFAFGNAAHGYNSFTLTPRSPDLGSYWLAQRNSEYLHRWGLFFPYCFGFGIVAPALSIRAQQEKRTVSIHEDRPLKCGVLCGGVALASQMIWRYGELVETGTATDDFLEALYRYVGLSPDPPGEFEGFTVKRDDSGGFWGIEIRVTRRPYTEKRG